MGKNVEIISKVFTAAENIVLFVQRFEELNLHYQEEESEENERVCST